MHPQESLHFELFITVSIELSLMTHRGALYLFSKWIRGTMIVIEENIHLWLHKHRSWIILQHQCSLQALGPTHSTTDWRNCWMSWRTNECLEQTFLERTVLATLHISDWHYRQSETREIIYVYKEVINDFKEKNVIEWSIQKSDHRRVKI